MTDVVNRLLEEIATAPDLAELATLERAATHLIEDLTAHLSDAIREQHEFLSHH